MRQILCALLVAGLFGAVSLVGGASTAAAQASKSVVGTTEGPFTDKLAACNSAKANARKQARSACSKPTDYQYGKCDCRMERGKRICKVEVQYTCAQ
jgi:hypothetical protein